MTKKAEQYIARRKAQILGNYLAGKDLPAHLVRRPDGVVVPQRMTHTTSLWGDRMVGPRGRLKVSVREPGAEWDEQYDSGWEVLVDDPNLVVTQAETIMANAMASVPNNAFNYIELGDPTFPANFPALGDTALQQTTAVRKAATVTASGNITTTEVTFLTSEGNGFTFTEAGLYTGPFAAGLMFARKTFNPIVKTASFEMKFTWLVTFLVNPQGTGDCAGIALTGPQTVSNETIYESVGGGEASVAATFDFVVGAAHLDVYLNGARLVRSRQYLEIPAGSLSAPVGGLATNKGIDFIGFALNIGDVVYVVQRTL